MATLDQLPPDRRAIIELVLRRGQSYEDLSGALGMPESRVREHAREALASLAPRSAKRVDPDWRGQVADYVLGQQAGPEAKATRSHLKRSEAARTWAESVLDSIGHLYPNGAEPQIPAGGRGGDGERPAPTPAVAAGVGAGGPPSGRDGGDSGARRPRSGGTASATARRQGLSSEARALVRRRRILGAVAGLIVVAGLVVLGTQLFGGDDESDESADAADAQAQPEPISTAQLQSVGDTRGSGAAVIFTQQGQTAMLARGSLPRIGRDETYGVWLFNDPQDAVALPTQTDPRGNFQALGPLPPDYENYQFVDVSAEEAGGRSQEHSGDSLLRGPIEPFTEESTGGGETAPQAPEVPELPTAPEGGG